MPRLRTIVVSAAFATAAALIYGTANRAYVENYNRNETQSAAAQKEIAALLPHIITLRTRFESANDDSRFLWRETNYAIEDAQRVLNTPVRADAERDCDILFRMNEINIVTGHEHRFSAESYKTLNMCRTHLTRFRGH
jgi:hypothetical protein